MRWPIAHPMIMQGKNIPQGTAVPDVINVNIIQTEQNIITLTILNLLSPARKVLIISDWVSKNKVANLLYYPSGQSNYLTETCFSTRKSSGEISSQPRK